MFLRTCRTNSQPLELETLQAGKHSQTNLFIRVGSDAYASMHVRRMENGVGGERDELDDISITTDGTPPKETDVDIPYH